MEPPLIDVIPNTAPEKPDDLDQMRAGHAGLVDGPALADPALPPNIIAHLEGVVPVVLDVGKLRVDAVHNLKGLLQGGLVILADLVESQVLGQSAQMPDLLVIDVGEQLGVGHVDGAHVVEQLAFHPQHAKHQLAQVSLVRDVFLDEVVHGFGPGGRHTEAKERARYLGQAVLVLLLQERLHDGGFVQEPCNFVNDVLVDLSRRLFQNSAEKGVDDILMVLSVNGFLDGLDLVVPVQKMMVPVVVLDLELLECADQSSLVVCQHGLGYAVVVALKEVLEQPLEVLSGFVCNGAHAEKNNPCVFILTDKEPNPQMFLLLLLLLEQFVGDVEADQVPIFVVVRLHALAQDQEYSVGDVAPEGDISFSKLFQQGVIVVKSPKQLRLNIFGLLESELELRLDLLDMVLDLVLIGQIEQILANGLNSGFFGSQLQFVAVVVVKFAECEQICPPPVLQH